MEFLKTRNFHWALGAYFFAVGAMSLFLGRHLFLGLFGVFVFGTFIPFVLFYKLIAAVMIPEIQKAQSLMQAMCNGSCAAMVIVVLVSLTAGAVVSVREGAFLGAVFAYFLGGSVLGLLPAIFTGSAFGYCVFNQAQTGKGVQP